MNVNQLKLLLCILIILFSRNFLSSKVSNYYKQQSESRWLRKNLQRIHPALRSSNENRGFQATTFLSLGNELSYWLPGVAFERRARCELSVTRAHGRSRAHARAPGAVRRGGAGARAEAREPCSAAVGWRRRRRSGVPWQHRRPSRPSISQSVCASGVWSVCQVSLRARVTESRVLFL